MFEFPVYSDLSNKRTQLPVWQDAHAHWAEIYNYYSGKVFEETVSDESSSEEDNPELYPVGVNLVKMLAMAQADAICGFWDESVVSFEPSQDTDVTIADRSAAQLLASILQNSNANSMIWELALEREVYGGACMKISVDVEHPSRIRWSRVPLGTFFPIWDPENPDVILEAYIVTTITPEQAELKYGIKATEEIIYRVEHWTVDKYETKVGGQRVDKYSGFNPWMIVPFVYIPRMRTSNWFGDSLSDDVMRVQDELNAVLADISEGVNFNSHPIIYGYNLPKKFNSKNYPVGPGYFWDLGRVIANSHEPTVNLLEIKNPIPEGTFSYIDFIYNYAQTSTFTPPVALGRDSDGQRSGVTVELRMGPLVRAIQRSRSYLMAGLSRAAYISAVILRQKDWSDISIHAVNRILGGYIVPRMAPIVPKDQASTVDEVQKGMSTKTPTISLETAVKKLGYGTSEVDRIKAMLEDKVFGELFKKPTTEKPIGRNAASEGVSLNRGRTSENVESTQSKSEKSSEDAG